MLCLDAMIPIKWEGVYKITLTTTVIHILVNTLYVSFQCVLASCFEFTFVTSKVESFMHSLYMPYHFTFLGVCVLIVYISIASFHGFPGDVLSLEHGEQPRVYPDNQGFTKLSHQLHFGWSKARKSSFHSGYN